jgi:threonine dehydratase
MEASVSLDSILAARRRLGDLVRRTPLIPLDGQGNPPRLYLKLENLQPTGSFKVRGAGNAILAARERGALKGVYTTSAGNMAQALAWHARRLGVPCTTIVPDTAPETKLAGIRRFGAEVLQLPWPELWEITARGVYPPLADREYIPPFHHPDMIAGNATIGLEIHEELPQVESVFVPFGGGGLSAGIAATLHALRPSARVVACEPDTAAPFAASLKTDAASRVQRIPSFVDGAGAENLLPGMWERLRGLVRESRVVSLRETASAIRFLFERHRVVAEGAAGLSVAAAMRSDEDYRTGVAVVSGGNIDFSVLTKILGGGVP